MALRPSRRIPHALQRRPSALSRSIARTFHAPRKRGAFLPTAQLLRQWRRWGRVFGDSLSTFRLWVLVFIGTGAIGLLSLSLFSSLFQVQSISVRRQDTRVDVEEVQQLLSPFFHRHLFFLSPRLLEDAILQAHPEVASVVVEKFFPHKVRLTLSMDPIVADIEVGAPEENDASRTSSGGALHQYLTSRGIYLAYPTPLLEAPEDGRLAIRVVDWAVKPSHRQPLVRTSVLEAMQHAENILRESFGHTVSSIVLYVRAQEFHVRTERLTLWFDMATPLVQQLDRYREFLRSVPPENAQEYVDLRLQDRVVYR